MLWSRCTRTEKAMRLGHRCEQLRVLLDGKCAQADSLRTKVDTLRSQLVQEKESHVRLLDSRHKSVRESRLNQLQAFITLKFDLRP